MLGISYFIFINISKQQQQQKYYEYLMVQRAAKQVHNFLEYLA